MANIKQLFRPKTLPGLSRNRPQLRLKGLLANSYRDPVVGRVGANALVCSEFNSNKDVSGDGYLSNFCEP